MKGLGIALLTVALACGAGPAASRAWAEGTSAVEGLDPPPGVRTEGVEAGLDARKACIEERSVVGSYVSTAEVRLTTQTGPDRRPNATVGGGFREGAAAGGAVLQPVRLALEEGWRLALACNPGVQAALERVAQASEQTRMASSSGRVQATLMGLREQVRTTPGPPTVLEAYGLPSGFGEVGQGLRFQTEPYEYGSSQFQLEIRQLLLDGGRVAAQVASTRALEGQAEALLVSATRDLRWQLEQAWLSVLEADARVDLAEESEALTLEQQRLTQARYEAGSAARADVVFARVPVARSGLDRVQARTQAASARAALNRLLGLPLGTPLQLEEPPAPAALEGTVDQAEDRARRQRAEVLQAGALIESARQELRVAEAGGDPRLDAVASANGVAYDEELLPVDCGWRVALEARWTLVDGGQVGHDSARARARIREVEALARQARDQVGLEARQAWLEAEAAEVALEASQVEVERAREALAMARGRYASGVALFLEVSQAQVDLLAARSRQTTARYALLRARTRLDRACGVDPPG